MKTKDEATAGTKTKKEDPIHPHIHTSKKSLSMTHGKKFPWSETMMKLNKRRSRRGNKNKKERSITSS